MKHTTTTTYRSTINKHAPPSTTTTTTAIIPRSSHSPRLSHCLILILILAIGSLLVFYVYFFGRRKDWGRVNVAGRAIGDEVHSADSGIAEVPAFGDAQTVQRQMRDNALQDNYEDMGRSNEKVLEPHSKDRHFNDRESQWEESGAYRDKVPHTNQHTEAHRTHDFDGIPPPSSRVASIQHHNFLTFIIPTVSRPTPYLSRTLHSLLSQLPHPNTSPFHPLLNSVRIMVVNNNFEMVPNEEYEELRRQCGAGQGANEESASQSDGASGADSPEERDFLAKCAVYVQWDALGDGKIDFLHRDTKNGAQKVLQQTADMTQVFKMASLDWAPSQYVIFMEDDWLLCENAFHALLYLVDKVERQFVAPHNDWIGMRFSYGLNGILMRGADVPALADFFEAKLQLGATHGGAGASQLKPPDHLIYDFMEREHKLNGRSIVVFRHNLYDHIGTVSSLMARNRFNPGCYGYMYDWLQPLEVFNNEACPYDDISPCPEARDGNMLVDWDTTSRTMHRKHFPLCGNKARSEAEAVEHACRLTR
uniref:Uncharacterized protein n=1 Tax=Percolomonas cosmopolitus TaxID=63605 RepID=A0A7S1KMH1_9EUKA